MQLRKKLNKRTRPFLVELKKNRGRLEVARIHRWIWILPTHFKYKKKRRRWQLLTINYNVSLYVCMYDVNTI